MRNLAQKLCCALSLISGTVFAAGFYGNQSDLKWKTAGTEHFQFMYPAEYSSHAAKVSGYAEAVYDSVVNRYSMKMPGKINVSLSNALYSNGSAVPSENALNLWLTNWDFKIRSSHGWLSDVVTHEFSHLVSIESGSKLPPSLYGVQISYTDYYNERTTTDFVTMIPFTLQPLWLAEGTAQFESSRMGFDGWDTHRDMLLRVAALNDTLLPLSYMHEFSDNSLYAELGPYTQGFALVRYIAKHYGEEAVPKIWKELGTPYRATLSGALKKVLGVSEQELYDAWKKEITEEYETQKNSLGELVTGEKVTADAFWQDFPVVAGDHIYGVSNFGGPWFDGSVFKMPLTDSQDSAATDSSGAGDVEIGEVEIEGAKSTVNIADYAKNGFTIKKAWFDKGIDVYQDSARGPILAYVSYQNRDKDGHAHFDIAVSDTSKNQLSVTYLADAVYPAIDRQGTTVAFVRREPFSTRFILSKVPFPKDFSDYAAEDPQDIFVPDAKYNYYNIYSPKFSPDGKRIAFGFFDDVQRGIAIIDVDGTNMQVVSNADYDERDVNWLDDNKIVFASNRNNIFNLIEKDLTTGAERPLTNVVGGAFTPTLAKDTLYYTQYDVDGFSLYKLAYSNNGADADTLPTSYICKDSVLNIQLCKLPLRDPKTTTPWGSREIVLHGTLPKRERKQIEVEDREFAGVEKDYKAIPTVPLFVPIISFNENAPDLTVFGEGELKMKAGLALILSDPLKKNVVEMGFLLELGNGFDFINADGLNPKQEKEFFVTWQNHSTPLDLGLSYSYATVRYEDVRAHEDSIGTSHYAISMQSIMGSAGYSIFKTIDTLQVALGYDWSNFNLYEDNFDWTYQKRISALMALGLYGDHSEEGTGIDGQGNGLLLYYQYANSDLYRPGTFAESFTVTKSGTIEPVYRNFNIHTVGLNLYGSLQSPLTGARLAVGGKLNGIIKWDTNAKEDSLDSYYYTPVFLAGYPYLRSSESYTLAGTKTAVAELHYLLPIYDDWRHTAWIFTTHDFYVDVFAQVGAAWNNKWFDSDKLTDSDFWDRSVGISFRMSNKLFYSIPLDITLTLARGLDRIGEDKDLRGGSKLTPIDVPLLPESVAPTRINFTLGMGFNNSWQ